MLALFVNAAILIVAAATFHASGHADVAEIGQAFELLSPLLGLGIASTLFAVALLASGLNSTVTATLAGQIVMEGFLRPARCRTGRDGCSPAASPSFLSSSSPHSMASAVPHSSWCSARSCCRCNFRSPSFRW